MRRISLILPLAVAALSLGLCSVCPAQRMDLLSGQQLTKALDQPLLATRNRITVRETVRTLGENLKIAILLDHRINPDQIIEVSINSPFTDEGLASIAESIGAELRVVADTVFIGPESSLSELRTRIALADRQVEDVCRNDIGRKLDLSRSAPVTWRDLTTPRGIAGSIADTYRITLENLEAIPYDLWGAGVIRSANCSEALLIIASQFDLDIEWLNPTTARLIPAEPGPVIEIAHRVQNRTGQEALLELLRAAYPQREIASRNNSIVLSATIEEHDQIDLLMGNKAPRKPQESVSASPLANRRFSLETKDAPLEALLNKLQEQGVQIEYDAEQLRTAGIKLDTLITVSVKDAAIREFMAATVSQAGLVYAIEGEKVILKPRP